MQKGEEFVAGVTRDVRVIEVMSQTLFTLWLIQNGGVAIDGEDDAMDFSCEIERLNAALIDIGVEGEDEDAYSGERDRSFRRT